MVIGLMPALTAGAEDYTVAIVLTARGIVEPGGAGWDTSIDSEVLVISGPGTHTLSLEIDAIPFPDHHNAVVRNAPYAFFTNLRLGHEGIIHSGGVVTGTVPAADYFDNFVVTFDSIIINDVEVELINNEKLWFVARDGSCGSVLTNEECIYEEFCVCEKDDQSGFVNVQIWNAWWPGGMRMVTGAGTGLEQFTPAGFDDGRIYFRHENFPAEIISTIEVTFTIGICTCENFCEVCDYCYDTELCECEIPCVACKCCEDCEKFPCECPCPNCDVFPCACCGECNEPDCVCCEQCSKLDCICCEGCDMFSCVCPCEVCGEFPCDCCGECEIFPCECCGECKQYPCNCTVEVPPELCGECEQYPCECEMQEQIPCRGDIDGDGSITINDALEILKYLAGLENVVEIDEPTIDDALEILKYLAGLPSAFSESQAEAQSEE
jgi:hypothetical protein